MENPFNQNHLCLILSADGVWEDKTTTIAQYSIDKSKRLVTICYKNSNLRRYQYKQERVQILIAEKILDVSETELRVDGQLLSRLESVVKFKGYYVVVSRGARKVYPESAVVVEKNIAAIPAYASALDYFREIANLISIKTEDDQALLTKQYQHLSRVSGASVLGAYLRPDSPLESLAEPKALIFPFGTNASQKAAVRKVFGSQVTIIQGPPGTGKTQTILNIIANAVRFGQSVAIVSNNNAATQNVAEKLGRHDIGFFLATLGKRANKEEFIQSQHGYPEWLAGVKKDEKTLLKLETRIAELSKTFDDLIQANNDRAILLGKIHRIQTEAELQRKLISGERISDFSSKMRRYNSNQVLALLVECEENGAETRTGFLRSMYETLRYGFFKRKLRRELLSLGPLILRSLYYEKYLDELGAELRGLERILSRNDFEAVQKALKETSMDLFRALLAARFSGKVRPTFGESDLWKKYEEILKEYPVVMSTTHSLKTSLSPECLYDLVIIDEASQVDVATGALVLSCAKRAVIVGDDKQLPNVIPEETKEKALAIWRKFKLQSKAWNYAEHSLLSSAMIVWPQAPNILLREHYRCHPQIAGFFNEQFYANQLIVMTRDGGEADAMASVFTVPGNHARGHINQRQIDVIKQEILPVLRGKGIVDIGIIAPYKAQVAVLRKHLIDDNVEIDTVHGFQGREKQGIILSTVDNEIGEFVDNPKMLNVAVSRAQRSFTVVLARGQNLYSTNFGDLVRYIRRHKQTLTYSQIRSVFDLLYSSHADVRQRFLKARGRTSIWDSESLAETIIQDILQSSEFRRMRLACMRHVPLVWLGLDETSFTERELEFVKNPWAHVDMLIFDSVEKSPLIAIEIDGWAFHRPGSLQSIRDEIKNNIFGKSGVPLIRLSTTGSGEASIIAAALRDVLISRA
ncbi:MAG: ATP-dependent RecD-like DNA helicase [Turneriella sp.]|nr:ATP-dependent RecD-like DNA helicase [Turneriella sp.]